jgi:hypothetical protein
LINAVSLEKAGGALRLSDWPAAAEGPLELWDFLHYEQSLRILSELESAESWVRQWQIQEPGTGGKIRTVDEETFRSTAPRSSETQPFWYCAVRTLSLGRLRGLPATSGLLTELNSKSFLDALSAKFGFAVAPASGVNGARYEEGDFLRAHQDNFEGWVGSLVVYLSRRAWSDEDGGRLGFHGANGVSYARPAHNSACIIPISDRNYHWVEPVMSAAHSRLSLNLHLCRS